LALRRSIWFAGSLLALAIVVAVTAILLKERTMSERHRAGERPAKQNRLASEKSPYLVQHADNPVDWYPWCEEAFERAVKEDRPIFLSIGYSTCHWCHVMEHESFEDPDVAALMNDAFVCIKVDREERPDIDGVYMTVCQLMTGSGGWPLTIIMTPDKRPFIAATYIPKVARLGRIGMLELIPRVRELWATRRDELLTQSHRISAALRETARPVPGRALDAATLQLTYEQLAGRFDEHDGGFGGAPKFPTPHNLLFLLRYWKRTAEEHALEMVEKTLQAMRRGGMYDHLGFGFHRYSTDSRWLVPHFEKMLYDQALLAMAYLETYQASAAEEYATTAREIFAYVLRDMTSPEGGFYSAEDADSEGEEGKFYVWTLDEIRGSLSPKEADFVEATFNIEEGGNFSDEATGTRTNSNILHLTESTRALSAQYGASEEEFRERLETVRQKLLAHREERIRPGKDDKILVDWNGLMIAALARGSRVLRDPAYAAAARRAADFILEQMLTKDGGLRHRYRDGEAAIAGHLDDYAFLIWGLLELYETTFEVSYLRSALDLNAYTIEHFWDESNGGFYFTADEAESLLVRRKESYDGARPSGNSISMLNLLRLAHLTANPDFEERAAQIGSAFSGIVSRSVTAHTQLMVAVDFAVGPTYEVVIVGDPHASDTKEMLSALNGQFMPNKVVLLRPLGPESSHMDQLAGYVSHQTSIDGKATAYVCIDHACRLPTTDIDTMLELLK